MVARGLFVGLRGEALFASKGVSSGEESSETTALDWRTGLDERVFESLRDPVVNLACWERTIPFEHEASLAAWVAEDGDFSFETSWAGGAEGCESGFEGGASWLDGLGEPCRSWLHADVTRLVRLVAGYSGGSALAVSLSTVRSNKCRKFHADYMHLRLVTTYVGPGTEWLPEEAIRREALGVPSACPDEANLRVVRSQGAIRGALSGHVVMMKGALHPGSPGAVHRSPPIEGSGLARLVLVISTVCE
jgi:hypothetical protein